MLNTYRIPLRLKPSHLVELELPCPALDPDGRCHGVLTGLLTVLWNQDGFLPGSVRNEDLRKGE